MFYIGYDIGSSFVKVGIVEADSGKKVISLHEPTEEMEILSLQNDWAEQNAELWWSSLCKATKRVIEISNVNTSEIIGIGISYQMHGLVVVDAHGKPLRDAIIWCDSRAVEIGNLASTSLGETLCRESLLNSPGNFTASKLYWVKKNEPKIYKQIYKFMLPGDFIAYKLTGKISTTRNGLSECILWDYKNERISKSVLDYFGINENLVPSLVENFTNQGSVCVSAASETSLSINTPVFYRAGDQPNNALSLNVLKNGEVAATGGTSGVLFAVCDRIKTKETLRINSFLHVNSKPQQPSIGKLLCINGAGIQYKWLKNLCKEESYEIMNEKASKIPIGSDGLMIFPFGNGAERVFGNINLGCQIHNLNFNIHDSNHLFRASLEGIAFSFVYGMEILQRDDTLIKVIRSGNDNLFQSSILSLTVSTLIGHKIEIYNTTGAIGAARAVGLKNGDYETFSRNIIKNDFEKTIEPDADKFAYDQAYSLWKEQLNLIINKTEKNDYTR